MSWVWPLTPVDKVRRPLRKMRRSEFSELDYIHTDGVTTRDAPFGTQDTPTYKPRLIGGNLVHVLERPSNTKDLPRYEKLSLVSDKPNHVDPRALTNFSRRYNQKYQDPFTNRKHNPTTINPFITKRPDSKDISSRYPTLPPIEENKIRNMQISTVFEPEPWTQRYKGQNGSDPVRNSFDANKENHMNGYMDGPLYIPDNNYQPPSSSNSTQGLTDTEFKQRLLTMVPKGCFLPETPIVLSESDEMRLLSILASELDIDPLKLREVYLDITNTADKNLTGYCQYQDIYHSLSRQSIRFPADLLQLVSALFVSDHRNMRDVRYEKFLSFIGVALKQRPAGFSQKNGDPKPTQTNRKPDIRSSPRMHRPGEPYFSDGGESKLMRMIEEQLNENEYVIDFDHLASVFQAEDRDRNSRLTADQIKMIVMSERIPLQESLINAILAKIDDHMSDYRYNWWSFLDFLERVQPIRKGVPFQNNKVEQTRRQPTPNWARDRSHSPLWRKEDPYGGDDKKMDTSREVISRMDQELRELEKNYEQMSNKMKPRDDSSWFKNFMQFADALYAQDCRYEGNLPYQDVYEWTKMYNEANSLCIPDHVINKALSDSTQGGNVNIHAYLTKLGRKE